MKLKKSEIARLNYACGMNASSVKKMCKFIFGEYFYGLEINVKDRVFDLLVYEKIKDETFIERFTQEYIDYFKEYWTETPGFRLKYFKGLNVTDL